MRGWLVFEPLVGYGSPCVRYRKVGVHLNIKGVHLFVIGGEDVNFRRE